MAKHPLDFWTLRGLSHAQDQAVVLMEHSLQATFSQGAHCSHMPMAWLGKWCPDSSVPAFALSSSLPPKPVTEFTYLLLQEVPPDMLPLKPFIFFLHLLLLATPQLCRGGCRSVYFWVTAFVHGSGGQRTELPFPLEPGSVLVSVTPSKAQ